MHALKERDVTTEQSIDTRSAAGKAFLDMLGVFDEFESTSGISASLRASPPPSSATEQFDAKAAEIRVMFSNQLAPKRTAGIRERMLAAGLPI